MREQSVGELIKIEEAKVGEFFEIRRTLEGWCASKAAKAGSKSQLAAIKARLDAMRVLDVTSDAWKENDIGFHTALAAATGNPLAVRMMEIMRESFSALYRLKRFIPNREEQSLIWQHHADVYEALQARSPERARAAIIAHMDFIEAKLTESLQAFDDGETSVEKRHCNAGRLIWLGCGGSSFHSPLWCWRALRLTRRMPSRSA